MRPTRPPGRRVPGWSKQSARPLPRGSPRPRSHNRSGAASPRCHDSSTSTAPRHAHEGSGGLAEPSSTSSRGRVARMFVSSARSPLVMIVRILTSTCCSTWSGLSGSWILPDSRSSSKNFSELVSISFLTPQSVPPCGNAFLARRSHCECRNRTTQELITEALEHFDRALEYSTRDLSDQLTLDVIAMRLSAGIDSLMHVEDGVLLSILGDQWPKMRGMRNRMAHGYAFVNSVIIVKTIESNLPPVVDVLRAQLGEN